MKKVVNIEDMNARTLITDLLSQDSQNREGLDIFQKSKYLSLEGHSLGQDVHFDKYKVITKGHLQEKNDREKIETHSKDKISNIFKGDDVSVSGHRLND